GVFERTESIAALTEQRTISTDDAHRVAAALDDLPLAITQANGYLALNPDVDGYLAELAARLPQVMSLRGADTHQASLAATITVAVTQLDAESPSALALLKICAFLAP